MDRQIDQTAVQVMWFLKCYWFNTSPSNSNLHYWSETLLLLLSGLETSQTFWGFPSFSSVYLRLNGSLWWPSREWAIIVWPKYPENQISIHSPWRNLNSKCVTWVFSFHCPLEKASLFFMEPEAKYKSPVECADGVNVRTAGERMRRVSRVKANGRWMIRWKEVCGWMILCTLASHGVMDGWRKGTIQMDGWMDTWELNQETIYRVRTLKKPIKLYDVVLINARWRDYFFH